MTGDALLSASRRASGLTQTELARRAGTSQAEVSNIEAAKKVPTVSTLERLLRQTGHRIIAIAAGGVDAAETAIRISAAMRPDSSDSPLRAFLDYSDSLARATGVERVVLGVTEPRPTGCPSWDAALAGLVEFWSERGQLPTPGWISDPSRFLGVAAGPHLSAYDLAPDLRTVPTEFRKRNVLIEAATLESV